MLINNHTDANKGKIKGYFYLEDIFGFCKCFKEVTKKLGFHLMFETNDLQNIIYTSMVDDIIVTFNNLNLFVPNFLPSVETQLMFNEATQNIYKFSFDDYCTERRVISDQINQVDVGFSQQVNSPQYFIAAHQTRVRADTPNKNNNNAIFINIDLRKYYVEIDGQRYPTDNSPLNCEQNDFIEQNKDLQLFYKNYIGEPILNHLVTYPDMKTKSSIEIIALRHQPDHITPKKIQIIQEYGADPDNNRLFFKKIRRREKELIRDGNK